MRYHVIRTYLFFVILFGGWVSCVKPYNPPALQVARNYLVVEGVAIPSGDTTVITLTRSRDLSDTTSFLPETNARVFVEATNGQGFQFTETSPGQYKALLSLTPTLTYRLRIVTRLGHEILSDYEPVIETPPIDSLHWRQDGDVQIFADSRDPNNNTRYYRWEYRETWEYRSYYDSYIGFENGILFYLDSTQKIYRCWDSAVSTRVILGTTENLGDDVILNQLIATVPQASQKISAKYSIEVFQYGLTRDAFTFWDEIRKNGSEVGGLFDPLPSQLLGNLQNASNPGEPVIGYFSVASRERKRLFIDNNQVINWPPKNLDMLCTPIITTADSAIYYLYTPKLLPAYYISGGGLAIADAYCVDCRLQGGINRKPGYWP